MSIGVATLLVLFGPAATAIAQQGLPPGYRATVTINGHVVPATPGTVIAVGSTNATGCNFATDAEVSGRVPDGIGAAALEIRLSVTDSCRMVVSSATVLDAPTAPDDAAGGDLPVEASSPPQRQTASGTLAVVNHFGWAKNRVEEYVNIPVTYTYVEMKYKRDGGRVYGGSAGLCRPWNDGGGWSVSFEACNWNPNGPNSVFIYGRYHFSSWIPPLPKYDLSARFTADLAPRYTCNVTDGNIPWGWGQICSGGIYY
jgi:hypothetical protein